MLTELRTHGPLLVDTLNALLNSTNPATHKEHLMAATTHNPEVQRIRHSVQTSYNELNRLIESHLARVESKKLYQVPTQDEWTIMQNLRI